MNLDKEMVSGIVKQICRKFHRRRILTSSKTVTAVTMIAVMLAGASSAFAQAKILSVHDGLADFDSRTARVAPTAAQRAMVTSLGARATWNAFGTPQSLIKYGAADPPKRLTMRPRMPSSLNVTFSRVFTSACNAAVIWALGRRIESRI